ncbi:phosphotransferase [Streptomyces erythrochromogenes]|uniref:phosphotransferase n=1 Tax=Streptomyces erythrochromogenes TaxID=285574 RepID=UPI0036384065
MAPVRRGGRRRGAPVGSRPGGLGRRRPGRRGRTSGPYPAHAGRPRERTARPARGRAGDVARAGARWGWGAARRPADGRGAGAARALAARLPALVEELTACGLPNTLVHGDFHPGNWRSDGTLAVIVDYADSAFGHPALDGLRPRQYVDGERWTQIAEVWARAWREHVPGSAPERALELVEPLFHLAYAVRYQEFLEHIETSERPYHETDPVSEVRRALACVRPGLTDH